LENHVPGFTVINAPTCLADPEKDGTNSEAFVLISFKKRIVLIGGTKYAGEIKKSIFSVMNYLLPQQNGLAMHRPANVGDEGVAASLFGLSGPARTSLSADSSRRLVGADEHARGPNGLFKIDGGCDPKGVELSATKEPHLCGAIR